MIPTLKRTPGQNFSQISYIDVMRKNLRVMDMTAITLCRENVLPIVVMNMNERGNLTKLINGEKVGSLVHS